MHPFGRTWFWIVRLINHAHTIEPEGYQLVNNKLGFYDDLELIGWLKEALEGLLYLVEFYETSSC